MHLRLNSDSLPAPLLFMNIISQARIVSQLCEALDPSIAALQIFFSVIVCSCSHGTPWEVQHS